MALIVVKFGGTSVADTDRIKDAASKVAREVALGHKVVVVVSAMSGVTNQLVDYCSDVNPMYDLREYDTVVSSGEQVAAGLMALALQGHGVQARSWMGWQVKVHATDMHGRARISGIDVDELHERLNDGEVAVVPGFQGITQRNRIATLGRGGSDTTAVALAAALGAARCDIYTDVDGVYTANPRIVPQARKLKKISYEEMIELASLGAKVLQTRSVEIAMNKDVPIQVLSSFENHIGSDLPGTLVTREEDIVEQEVVSGIAYSLDEAKVTVLNVPDIPGVASELFTPLAKGGVNIDMIVQNVAPDGKKTDMTFTINRSELANAVKVIGEIEKFKDIKILTADNVSKVSVVGIGMVSHQGVASRMFQTLADKGINIHVIATSEVKISVLIDEDYTELAVRALHSAYGLEE